MKQIKNKLMVISTKRILEKEENDVVVVSQCVVTLLNICKKSQHSEIKKLYIEKNKKISEKMKSKSKNMKDDLISANSNLEVSTEKKQDEKQESDYDSSEKKFPESSFDLNCKKNSRSNNKSYSSVKNPSEKRKGNTKKDGYKILE